MAQMKDESSATTAASTEGNMESDSGPSSGNNEEEEIQSRYPQRWQQYTICFALAFAIFIPAVDQTIVSTAIPRITKDFHSTEDVGWYGSAYMMTSAALQLTWGKAFSLYNPKWGFLVGIFIFELGSLICAVSPSSAVLILGRAIAGCGCSGIVAGAITISALTLPLRLRPIFNGALGIFFGVAASCGPILGGAFVHDLDWRWSFWINLPIGGATFLFALIFIQGIKSPTNSDLENKTWFQKVKQFDFIGTPVLIISLVCLFLALEWGGSKYNWSNARIIVLLVLAAVFCGIFIFVQHRLGDAGALPLRLLRQRSISCAALYTFLLGAALQSEIYFIPIWFQAVKGVNALQSGVMTLPLVIAWAGLSLGSGILISLIGHYVPFMLLGSCLATVGIGLVTTFQPDTPHQLWIAFLFLCGAGAGAGLEQPQIAAQTVLKMEDIPLGISIIVLAQELGGSTFVSIVGNILNNRLRSELSAIPGINAAAVVAGGATKIRTLVHASVAGRVIEVYNQSLVQAFYASLVVSGLSFFAACGMEWRSVKEKPQETETEPSVVEKS